MQIFWELWVDKYNGYLKHHCKWDYLLLCLLMLSIRKHLHYWLQNHIHVMKQWGLHWVQVHQGDCSQQKTRFTHWQKWKRSLFPYSSPPSICTCKLLAFSCNMEITQMVIILRKTFAFCKKASSLGKIWWDFCMAFLSPVTYWQKFEKKVSFPRKAEQRSTARAWWPWCMWFISCSFS